MAALASWAWWWAVAVIGAAWKLLPSEWLSLLMPLVLLLPRNNGELELLSSRVVSLESLCVLLADFCNVVGPRC